MKITFTFFLVILLSMMTVDSKSADSPYPVIFVHGLNSDDQTWNTTITQLSQAWNLSSSHTLHAVLNARGGDTTSFTSDVLIPLRDASGNIVNSLSMSSIYSVNFGNFWNRNLSDPRILLYNNSLPGTSQSPSNQSAITKQAFALSIMIDSVLRITGASKVILIGHSMGGLAIREYLQRREGGLPKWWIDPLDTISGHKVAKVVTTGTPHLGTNVTSIPILTIDNNSEAMRDMRITYTSGQSGAYLFTNSEANVTSNYYNKDINCNNTSADNITGLSSGNSFNSLMPFAHKSHLHLHYIKLSRAGN
ncbi:MAG: alpha/beta fold hydrolase [Ignavibacteria bacterium]|nr:alpha/beta fold hydrolase [Ignavibacteria bacterium]